MTWQENDRREIKTQLFTVHHLGVCGKGVVLMLPGKPNMLERC